MFASRPCYPSGVAGTEITKVLSELIFVQRVRFWKRSQFGAKIRSPFLSVIPQLPLRQSHHPG
jgi:hypothetical protein